MSFWGRFYAVLTTFGTYAYIILYKLKMYVLEFA